MKWAKFSRRLTDAAIVEGRFIDLKSRIGLRPNGTEFVKLGKLDWDIQKQRVIERDRWKCQGCGAGLYEWTAEVHHIRHRGRGGDDSMSNLALVGGRFSECKCHVRRHPQVKFGPENDVRLMEQ